MTLNQALDFALANRKEMMSRVDTIKKFLLEVYIWQKSLFKRV